MHGLERGHGEEDVVRVQRRVARDDRRRRVLIDIYDKYVFIYSFI